MAEPRSRDALAKRRGAHIEVRRVRVRRVPQGMRVPQRPYASKTERTFVKLRSSRMRGLRFTIPTDSLRLSPRYQAPRARRDQSCPMYPRSVRSRITRRFFGSSAFTSGLRDRGEVSTLRRPVQATGLWHLPRRMCEEVEGLRRKRWAGGHINRCLPCRGSGNARIFCSGSVRKKCNAALPTVTRSASLRLRLSGLPGSMLTGYS